MPYNSNILETINMIEKENLDIRTLTLGISLLDCIDSNIDKCCDKIYNKITRKAENLVAQANRIQTEFGIPIVNERIAVTPISLLGGATSETNYIKFAKALDRAAKAVNVNFIGGFSAIVPRGFTKGDITLIESIPEALAQTERVMSSINLGNTKIGINMDAVAIMGDIIKETAYLTRHNDSYGCTKLVVFCNAVDDNPFMAGAFQGITQPDTVLNVGVSGPGVVKKVLEKMKGAPIQDLAEEIKKTAFKITRAGQIVGSTVAHRLGVQFGIIDLSLAPTPEIGDSVGRILEEFGIEHTGGAGTTAALAVLNDAVKKGGLMAAKQVGGLSGAFIPVSEDEGMIEAAGLGFLTLDKLEAMTAVCSVGIDMVAVPGDTKASVISGIIADEAAIGMVNSKTTAVRIIPVYGKKEGEVAEFGGLLGKAPIIKVNSSDCSEFIKRGGYIPAPIHSFKN